MLWAEWLLTLIGHQKAFCCVVAKKKGGACRSLSGNASVHSYWLGHHQREMALKLTAGFRCKLWEWTWRLLWNFLVSSLIQEINWCLPDLQYWPGLAPLPAAKGGRDWYGGWGWPWLVVHTENLVAQGHCHTSLTLWPTMDVFTPISFNESFTSSVCKQLC